MADSGWVDIEHKATGLTSTVLESTVPAWATAGWTVVENGSEGEVAPQGAPDSSSEPGSDPGLMTEE